MSERPRARTTIVDEVFEGNYVKNENWTFAKLVLETHDNLSVIQWLARRRLILNNMNCPECGKPLTLKCSRRGVDVWEWRCRTDKVTRSVRWNSFFSKSPLSFQKILLIIYLWAYHFSQTSVAREIAVSKETVGEWFKTLQKVCDEILKMEQFHEEAEVPDEVPIKVEIDEVPNQVHMDGDPNIVQMDGTPNRVRMDENPKRVRMSENPSRVHMSGDSNTLHMAGDSNTPHMARDSNTPHMAGGSDRVCMDKDPNQVQMNKDSSRVYIAGDSSTLHTAGDSNTPHTSGDSNTLHTAGDSNTLHTAGDSNTLHMAGGTDRVHMDKDPNRVHMSKDPSRIHMARDSNTLHRVRMDEDLFESDENRAYIAEFMWRQRAGANKFSEIMYCIISTN